MTQPGYGQHPYPQAPETVGPARAQLPAWSEPLEQKLDWLIGMLSRHDEKFERNSLHTAAPGNSLAAGTKIFDSVAFADGMLARTLIIDNTSSYVLRVDGVNRLVPPGAFGYVVPCQPALRTLNLSVVAGNGFGTVNVWASEGVFQPDALTGPLGSTNQGAAVSLAGVSAPALLSDTDVNPLTYKFGADVEWWSGSGWVRGNSSFGAGSLPGQGLGVGAVGMYGFTGGAVGIEAMRLANIAKTVVAAAAGNTAVWTPVAGKKFRLMGYEIMVTENASLGVAGLEEITFQDSATALGVGASLFIPAAAGAVLAGGFLKPMALLGHGLLSAAANNVLNVNLGTALATGELRVNVIGTEE